MKNLMKRWLPLCLLIGGGVLLWLLGYGTQDRAAIVFMALLITAAGGYLSLAERQKRN
ncbi:hypothetical protein [Bradyrhizobium sp. USDA 313]|uniref:hypothetical protein n=1 Tax=Bradyrhizobium sp. USDA 313 TaxID=3156307 RepID=UPI003515E76C